MNKEDDADFKEPEEEVDSWIEEVDIDDFLHPGEAYIHEGSLTEEYGKKVRMGGKKIPTAVTDGEELYIMNGNATILRALRSGKTSIEVRIYRSEHHEEELEETRRCVQRAEKLGVKDFQSLNRHVLDDRTYDRINRIKDIEQQKVELDKYINNHNK